MLGIRLPEVNLSHAPNNGVKPDKQRGCKSPNASDIGQTLVMMRAQKPRSGANEKSSASESMTKRKMKVPAITKIAWLYWRIRNYCL